VDASLLDRQALENTRNVLTEVLKNEVNKDNKKTKIGLQKALIEVDEKLKAKIQENFPPSPCGPKFYGSHEGKSLIESVNALTIEIIQTQEAVNAYYDSQEQGEQVAIVL
jgi:hypothetical protein